MASGPSGHAKLSPSAAKRWLTCPASVEACANVVSADTEHSMNGTAGHWVFAEWLLKGEPPAVGTVAPNGVVITQELIDLAGAGVGWVRQYIAGRTCNLLVEEQVEIGPYFGIPEGLFWGTTDCFIMSSDGELVVFDLKLGYVDVPAEDNEQLLSYAAGFIRIVGALFERVRLVIVQPKRGEPKESCLSMAEVLAKLEEMKPKVVRATLPDQPYVPDDAGCKWCPVYGVCKAAQAESLALAKQEFDSPTGLLDNITVEELSLLLKKADLIEGALKAAKAHAAKLIACGVEVPGFKRVEKDTKRRWKDGVEEQVRETFKSLGFNEDDYAPRSILSFGQAEKLAGKKAMAPFIEKPKGEPMLAPVTDNRPALPPDFQALDASLEAMLD